MLAGAYRTWFDTARRLVDMDWYRYNTGRDTRLISGCGRPPRVSEDPRSETLKEGVSSLRIPAGARKQFQLLVIVNFWGIIALGRW